jgi:hypothetical protein
LTASRSELRETPIRSDSSFSGGEPVAGLQLAVHHHLLDGGDGAVGDC